MTAFTPVKTQRKNGGIQKLYRLREVGMEITAELDAVLDTLERAVTEAPLPIGALCAPDCLCRRAEGGETR